MTDSDLIKLLEKYKNKDCTNDELILIDHWYKLLNEGKDKQLPTNVFLNEKKYIDEQFSLLEQKIKGNIHQTKSRRYFSIFDYRNKLFKAVAATVFLGIMLFFLWKKYNAVSNKDIRLIENIVQGNNREIKKIILPDKSIVWLKGKSKLSFPSVFIDSIRSVSLDGEALFEVSKDKTHPFVIHSGRFLTRVLGTSFNLKVDSTSNTLNLVVLTGKVMVTQLDKVKNNIKPIYITPGKGLYATINGRSNTYNVKFIANITQKKIIDGTEYDMNFENLSFDIIKKRIENKFNVSINANDELYKNCFISADLTDQSLDNSLKILSIVLGANYSIKNKYINITGGGCN
ncbi:FecR family protein [Rhizosphaericola mali]|uniref:FecR family protein n=1 Tax=Rhizosphaericola mali TaxID=2545455 RepID=A0A5P2FYF8_9BACT|nr:FecR family protein [Rhizosphaericola mali]QES88574.1 FecR family protein [Rhizosphaericola mali]